MPDRDLIAEARGFAIHTIDEAPHIGRTRDVLTAVTDELEAARARIAELEHNAVLADACRPPEVTSGPSDAELNALVRALEGTGDPLWLLGSELVEKRARVTELMAAHQRDLAAIAAKQQRDAARIAELEDRASAHSQRLGAIARLLKIYSNDDEDILPRLRQLIERASSNDDEGLVIRWGSEEDDRA